MNEEMQSVLGTIPYTIVRSGRRKTSEIQVDADGVEIRVPFEKLDQDILKMLNNKSQWILDKYSKFQAKKMHFKVRLGEPYVMKRVKALSSQIGVNPTKILVKPLRTRWGSATLNCTITINSRLFKAPDHVVDYVIVHELCHLKIRGHSSTYWNLVEMHMPGYAKSVAWLKKYGKFI